MDADALSATATVVLPGAAPAPWDVPVLNGVDLLVLNDAPRELAGNIALRGELLFESDPAERVHWLANT